MAHNRFKRPQSSMMSALKADIISECHDFETVSADIPLPKRQRLDDSYFEADPSRQSLRYEEISNVEVKAHFYSPKSENNHVLRLGG